MEGARQLSLVRWCGGHFDIIVVGLLPPSHVWLKRLVDGNELPRVRGVEWDDFVPCISTFPTHLVLVWDWSPENRHDEKSHIVLFENDATDEQATYYTRLFETASVLDHLGRKDHLDLLVQKYSLRAIPGSMQPQMDVLFAISAHWDDYFQFKNLISQLKWSGWLLRSQEATELVLGFWVAEGIMNWSFRDLLDLISSQTKVAQIEGRSRIARPSDFGESQLTSLLCRLFPDYAQFMDTTTGKSPPNMSGYPMDGRYMMHLILAEQRDLFNFTEEHFGELVTKDGLEDAICLMLAIVSEFKNSSPLVTPGLLAHVQQINDFARVFTFLVLESLDNPESTYLILKQLRKFISNSEHFLVNNQVCREILIHCAHLLQRSAEQTNFLDVVATHLDGKSTDTMTMLEDLYGSYYVLNLYGDRSRYSYNSILIPDILDDWKDTRTTLAIIMPKQEDKQIKYAQKRLPLTLSYIKMPEGMKQHPLLPIEEQPLSGDLS